MSGFQPTLPLRDLPEGRGVAVEVEGRSVLLVRLGADVRAVENQCAHAGTRFDGARAVNGAIVCPMHGARFDLATGRCLNSPYESLATYCTRVREDGIVEVAAGAREP